MKRIFTLAVAALVFASSAIAQDRKPAKDKGAKEFKGKGDKHGRHGQDRGKFAKELNLTDAQKQQLKTLNEEYRAKFQALKAVDSKKETREKAKALKQEQQTKRQNILTAEQKAKMAELKEKRKTEAKEKGKERGEKMKKELGLTEAQGQKIKAINEDFHAKAKAIKDNQSLAQDQKKEQFKALNEQRRESMKAVLTAEQIQKMEAKKKEGKGRKERKDK
jgi:Spy/CpxP family protein refolding chaperone